MTPDQRYKAMASNRGRTRPERTFASALWREGVRYLTHDGYKSTKGERILGNPDLVFPKKRIVIFVDGCFWHGCAECCKSPEKSGEFWVNKIATNKERDQRVTSELKIQGWTVLRIPEHSVRSKAALARVIDWLLPIIRTKPAQITSCAVGDQNE